MVKHSKFSHIFIDTWGWLALGNSNDSYHSTLKRLYADLHDSRITICTSDYVLDELISLLFRRERFEEATNFVNGILAAAKQNIISIEYIDTVRFARALDLRIKYKDKPLISFTDFTSMALMQELKINHILTQDDHFIQVGMGFLRVPFDTSVTEL